MTRARTADRLLEAGRRLISQSSAQEVSLREIAAEAGVTPAAIYRHFPNKEALVDRVVADGFATLANGLWQALARFPVGSIDRLAEVGRTYVAFAREHPTEYGLLFAARAHPPPIETSPMQALIEIVEQCVRDCIASRALAPNDVRLVTLTLWSRLHGLITLFQAFDFQEQFPGRIPGDRLDAAAEATRGLLFSGLQRNPDGSD